MNKKVIDIRGEYPHDFNEAIAEEKTKAFLNNFRNKTPVVGVIGHDVRLTSKKIFTKVLDVIEEELPKATLVNLGLCTTPQMQFITNYLGADFGMMITASHNPPEYNGLKAIWNKNPARVVSKKEPIDIYAEYLVGVSDARRSIKVVFDASNGTTGVILKKVLPNLKDVEAKLINDNPDGRFPAHGPNPSKPEALMDVSNAVKEHGAEIGVVFDADGDRAVFVDEEGSPIDVEIIACLLVDYLGAKSVMVDSTVGKVFKNNAEIEEILPVPVHSDINSLMGAKSIALGFERSGHFYFPVKLPEIGKEFNLDSGVLAAIHVVSAISKLIAEGAVESMSQYVGQFSGEYMRVHKDFKVEDVEKIMEKVEEEYKDGKASKLDGLTVEYENWWFNIRRSTTEPVVRLNIEANSKELLKEKFDKFLDLLV